MHGHACTTQAGGGVTVGVEVVDCVVGRVVVLAVVEAVVVTVVDVDVVVAFAVLVVVSDGQSVLIVPLTVNEEIVKLPEYLQLHTGGPAQTHVVKKPLQPTAGQIAPGAVTQPSPGTHTPLGISVLHVGFNGATPRNDGHVALHEPVVVAVGAGVVPVVGSVLGGNVVVEPVVVVVTQF